MDAEAPKDPQNPQGETQPIKVLFFLDPRTGDRDDFPLPAEVAEELSQMLSKHGGKIAVTDMIPDGKGGAVDLRKMPDKKA